MNNKQFFISTIFLVSILSFTYSTDHKPWIESLPKPWTLTEMEVSELLPQFHDHYPEFHERLKAFALWQIGKPYEIFKLGEEIEPDPDPIIRLDVSDCTVHVLTCLAFSQSNSWIEAKNNMINIHYKDGAPSFSSRWHFTSERIIENPSTRDISPTLTDKLKRIDITLNQQKDGSEFLDLNWTKKKIVNYIPNEMIDRKLLNKLPNVCGVAFVKESYFKNGIVMAHEGMIIDQTNLVHASKESGITVNVNFLDYYFREKGPLFDGIMVYEFHPLD